MPNDSIKLPVRYDEKTRHIFEADGNSTLHIWTNTHRPDYDRTDERGQFIATAINEYAALKAENARLSAEVEALRWIRCEDRLPITNGYCLVTYADGNVCQAYFWADSLVFTYDVYLGSPAIRTVVAWREMPKPFEETKANG